MQAVVGLCLGVLVAVVPADSSSTDAVFSNPTNTYYDPSGKHATTAKVHFVFSKQRLAFEDAAQECISIGGRVANFESERELINIQAAAAAAGVGEFYVGLAKRTSPCREGHSSCWYFPAQAGAEAGRGLQDFFADEDGTLNV